MLTPIAPMEFTPVSPDMHHLFQLALDSGHVQGGPEDGETVEWSTLQESAPTRFVMLCTFTCNLELESQSLRRPCGSYRSDNWIVAAYPGKGPTEGDAADLN